VREEKAMKTIIVSACACITAAVLCFGFLWWNSGTIASDAVQVVKIVPCQYRENPTGKLLPGTKITFQSLRTGRLYGPMLCSFDQLHSHVGDDLVLYFNTVPGYASPPSGVLTFIRYAGAIALAAGIWLIGRMWRAWRKPNA
jgi:hypothetical protein